MERTETRIFRTPFGWAGVAATGKGIAQIVPPRKTKRQVEKEIPAAVRGLCCAETGHAATEKLLKKAIALLTRHLSGKIASFDLPLDLRYYTAFQQAVWRAAASIPRGETRSYAWIATRIKRPKAVRAVGNALGANPVPILIP